MVEILLSEAFESSESLMIQDWRPFRTSATV